MAHAIELRRVRKTFGPKVAVEGLDLDIEDGALIGLIGPNGAGKTTTIRMIMSIIFPDSGDMRVLGRASAIESKDRIGYLPEERGLYKKMKVGTFLKYVAKLKGVDAPDAKVREWLDRVGLVETYRKPCEELSKGMQQKVQFIAAIIHQPDLLILDEPFSGLDPVNARMLRALFDEQHARGCTVIFSTHQMSQAEAMCDRVVMIHQGQKVLDDSPARIRDRFDPHAVVVEPLEETADDGGALLRLPGVAQVKRMGSAFEVYSHPGVDLRALMSSVVQAVPANRVQLLRPSLEDIFVEIVTKSARTEAERAELSRLFETTAVRANAGGD
jgi:ABC-2 type transport system ATP-binding protein